MTSANFKLFCNLLSENLILQTYTAFGVMVDLKNLLQGIKTDIYSELYTGNNNSSVYLELLLNEIEETDYPKKYDKVKIDLWLTKYNISLNEIFNQNIFKNQFHKVIDYDTYTGDNILVQNDKQNYHLYNDALNIQNDFLIYFKCFYANEAINFINSLKMDFKPTSNSVQKSPVFENQYLDEFCKKIQDINSLKRTGFLQYYELGILHFTDYLKEEIYKNLVSLSTQKSIAYLNFVKAKISNTNFFETPPDILESIIVQYDTKNEPFPFKDNQKIKNFISTCYNRDNLDEWQREKMYEMQHTFFEYASMVEAKKIFILVSDLLQEKSSETIIPDDMKKNTSNSITSAQIVKDLIKNITSLRDFYQGLKSSYITFDQEIDSIKYEIERETGETKYIEKIKNSLNELYLQSNKDNYYFFDCTLKAYLSNIDKKIKDYLELHVDANMIDFYKTEINYLLNPADNRLLYSHNKKDVVNYNYFCNDFSNFEISLNKKIEYITNELLGLGVETTIEETIAGRDGDMSIKNPRFKKFNKPYVREKVDIVLTPGQNYEASDTKTSITPPKKSDYNTKIFKSRETEDWFRDTLLEMNAITNANIAYRGLPAVANAIFRNKLCKENIFKTRVYLKDYIGYLNDEFNANIKSDKSLSNGQNFEIDVQTIIKQFITENPQ